MADAAELEHRFWKALEDDRTMMLGLDGVEDGHARPMTAQFENDQGPIWFFCAADNALLPLLERNDRAIATFTAKDHDLFATVHGRLRLDRDQATIDRLWNRFVAAWFDGKDDPKLRLLRLEPEQAEIWLDANSLFAGMKMMLGIDPKRDYEGKVGTVELSGGSPQSIGS